MPSPFRPTTIPLVSGVRQDIADQAADDARALRLAENVVFTRTGGVRPRPARKVHHENVREYTGAYPATGSTNIFSDAIEDLQPAGLVAVPGAAGDTALALYQSKALRLGTEVWSEAGYFWSTRKTASADLGVGSSDTQVPVGARAVGIMSTVGGAAGGLPYLDSAGSIEALASVDITTAKEVTTAGVLTFYITAADELRAIVPGTFPAVTTTSLWAGVRYVSATPLVDGSAIVCFSQISTPLEVYTLHVTPAGVAGDFTQSVYAFNVTNTAVGVYGFGTYNVLVAAILESGTLESFVDTFDSVTATFSGPTHHKSHPGTAVGSSANSRVSCGVGVVHGNVTGVILRSNGSDQYRRLDMTTRELTSPDEIAQRQFWGYADSLAWYPLFGVQELAGRPVVGIQRVDETLASPTATWYVLDIGTSDNSLDRQPLVACGPVDGCARTKEGPAVVVTPTGGSSATSLRFGVVQGRTFDVDGVESSSKVAVYIDQTPASACPVVGGVMMTGTAPYVYDGHQCAEAGFVEPPVIMDHTVSGGGTLTPLGSYSYQTCWAYTDGAGRVVRSRPSTVLTFTQPSPAVKVTLTCSVPQVNTFRDMRLEVYCTVANPTAGADKFLIHSETIVDREPIDVIHQTEPSADAKALYTGGGIFADENPPAGDRGVAQFAGRTWVADERNLYASKLSSSTYATAWSTEGLLTVPVPAALGYVEALVGTSERLVAMCSGGVLLVSGPGVDDLGNGPGWSSQDVVGIGCRGGPRAAVAIPDGVAFIGTDGGIYRLQGLSVQCISRPVRLENDTMATSLAYVEGGRQVGDEQSTNAMLVVSGILLGVTTHRVLDLETGQWATWLTGTSTRALT